MAMDTTTTPKAISPSVNVEDKTGTTAPGSYVEWGPVFAGALVALAVSFVLVTFGGAVGVGAINPWGMSTTAAVSVSIGAAFWALLSYAWAFLLGGYLTGRLRHRWAASPAEIDFRDGAHGLVCWAVTICLSLFLAALTLSGGDKSSRAMSWDSEPVASTLDALLRPAKAVADTRLDDIRPLTARLLARSQTAPRMTPTPEATASRAQLVQLVTARTGLSESDADKRVSDASGEVQKAASRAKKLAVMIGFLTAATALIAAAAAWIGAEAGGKNRDDGSVWVGFSPYKG